MRRSLIVTVLAVVMLAPAAPSASGATVPKPEFIQRADSVCASFYPRLNNALEEINSSAGNQQLARATEQFVRVLKHAVDKIQRIGTPDRGQATLKRWYRLQSKVRKLFLKAADAARDGDAEGVFDALDPLPKLERKIGRAARSFGFRAC
jgi:hypothetical protein